MEDEGKQNKRKFSNLNNGKRMKELVKCNGVIASNPWQQSVSVECHNSSGEVSVSVYFDNIHQHIINSIKSYGENQTVVGCIAWLSNRKILNTLSKCCKRIIIIVNDEDYSKWGNGKVYLLYNELPRIDKPLYVLFSHLKTPLNTLERNLSKNSRSGYAPVRAFGNPFRRGGIMHSKYLVLFKNGLPNGVLTGSINYTKKSEQNQENMVFIQNEEVAMGYFNDFSQTFMLSTPINIDDGKNDTKKQNDESAVNWGW